MLALTINPDLVTLFLGVGLPVVLGAVLHSHASQKVKAAVMLAATLVTTIARAIIDSKGVISQDQAIEWGKLVVVTVATYYGVWKPVGVGNILPGVGIGKPVGDPGTVDPGEPGVVPDNLSGLSV